MIRALGLVALLLAAGCGHPTQSFSSQEPPPETSSPETTSPETTRPEATASGRPGPPPSSPSLVDHNGTLESPLSDFKARVLGTSWAASLTDSLHGMTRPDGRYLLVRVAMRNITGRPVYPPAHLSLDAANGAEFAPVWDQTFGQTVLVGHGKVNDLKPGATTTVVLVYDLPGGTRPEDVAGLRL